MTQFRSIAKALASAGDVLFCEQHIQHSQQIQIQTMETHGAAPYFYD
jgi:ribosomal 50S subunit-recycling heat shock protein